MNLVSAVTSSTKLRWITGTATACYLLTKYAKHKWQTIIEEQSNQAQARKNLSFRFELFLKDLRFVVESILPSIKDLVFQELNVELTTSQLKQLTAIEKNRKMELWDLLKIQAFSRILATVYMLNLLTVFTTIQLSILGRTVYLDSVVSLAKQSESEEFKEVANEKTAACTISQETERHYLTLSWYLLNIGWKKCVDRVQTAVKKSLDE